MTKVRTGPDCASTGLAQDAFAGVKHSSAFPRLVVHDDEQPVPVRPGSPDRRQRGQGVIGALMLAGDAPQLVIAHAVAAVEAADAVGAMISRAQPGRPFRTGRPGPAKYPASLRKLQWVNGWTGFSGRVLAAVTMTSISPSLIRRGRPPAHRGSSAARPLALNAWITSRTVPSPAATSRAIAGTSVPDADAMMIIARRTRTDPCFPRRTICSSRRPS